jgi:general secretion pathway protein G
MKRKGFTLIELLVVIAIIGLLSTLAVVALNSARTKARDAKRVADIKQIQTALELYYNDKSAYPTEATIVGLGSATDLTISSDNGIAATAAGTSYMGNIPKDPSNPTANCANPATAACLYGYMSTDGSDYEITFWLEGAVGNLTVGAACATETGIAATCIH